MSEPQAGEGPGHEVPGDVKLTPFLKWPGGKRWLVSMCPDVFPREFGTYIEPFLGAASVYFHIRPQRAILGDLNEDLVSVYRGVKEDPGTVQALLEKHQSAHCRDYYYEVRNVEPESLPARAARIIYLNRTCFNGIYRVNRQGKFNVPIGERDQVVRATDDFPSVAALLIGAELHQGDFEQLVGKAQPGDLVFLDPPYTVRHNRNGFIKYNERLFSWEDQEWLARTAAAAAQRGACVVVTNASHPTVRQLYPEELFTFREVSRYSSISASVDSRKHFDELIISSRESVGSVTPDVFFTKLEYQETPLAALTDFLEAEGRFELAQQTDKMRFVGYVLDIGYDTATIITSDPYKVAVGGIPRGSFLILAPHNLHRLPPHFTLLRVLETAPTPLSVQVQQTYFELHKKSMPELDVWTQGELQWGALRCAVLGMFYPNKGDSAKVDFSGDVNNVVSAHRYRVYAPDAALLDLIVNGLVRPKKDEPLPIGQLRPTENQLASILGADSGNEVPATTVKVSVDDFKGARTAMFGKTRLGKSNVVKLLVQAIIDATESDKAVGQLIFDINGEYANDNPQNLSIRTANPDVCDVYALTKRPNTPSRPLRINFYEAPAPGIEILGSMLEQDSRKSIYIEAFASVGLPSIEEMRQETEHSPKNRGIRRILTYWAILHEAGFAADENRLRQLRGNANEGTFLTASSVGVFDPHFNKDLRAKTYGPGKEPAPPQSLDSLVAELKKIVSFSRENENDKDVKDAFKADDWALFDFLVPRSRASAGPTVLARYRNYHSYAATDFEAEIIKGLDQGRTIILDLGNANDRIRVFFADMLSRAVFRHQEDKFSDDKLGEHFIQLYFEEAHNLFPATAKDLTGVYSRFAKEGAKFHIGMTYSTQSPSTIYGELLAQTENFFVGHLSSSQETSALVKLQRAFSGVEEEIMRSRTPGYMRMLTQSHRFVIPVQARLFEARRGA